MTAAGPPGTDDPGTSHPDHAGVDGGLAYCYRHPLRETGVRCTRCGRPICPDCMRPAAVGFHCPDDVKLGARSVRTPRTVAGAPARVAPPRVTYSLIGLNVLVYIITVVQASGRVDHPAAGGRGSLFTAWQLQPTAVADGGASFLRLLGSAFLHVNLIHLALNMVALAVVGPFVEQVLGWWRYLALYLLSALGGSVAVYLFANHFQPVAGASGAIYGVFAAALVLAHRIRLDLRILAVILVLNFLITFTITNISVAGHIGGFVVGAALAAVLVWLPVWIKNRRPLVSQLCGLAAIGVVLLIAVAVRTATFPVG